MTDHLGPIVRINPMELSIADPNFYDKVYVSGHTRRTQGYSQFASGIGFEGMATFQCNMTTILNTSAGTFFLSHSHELHRKRRKPVEPYFSRHGVTKLEPVIHKAVNKLIARFESLKGSERVIRLDHAMLAFSGDVIGHVCVENPAELIEDEDFSPAW
jgi:cytochrome P450